MKRILFIFSLFLFLSLPEGFTQEAGAPFASDILKFKDDDKIHPPPLDAILFAGSSSFTLWKDVQDYFPGFTIINRGFGGSTLMDQVRYVQDVVFPYHPRQIVLYCGENDLAYSDSVTAEMVTERFISWFNLVRSELPVCRITYVSMKPSPSRWHLADKMEEGNDQIRDFIQSQQGADFVDVWDSMLDISGRPIPAIFLPDSLHMNENGYKLWQQIIEPKLTRP